MHNNIKNADVSQTIVSATSPKSHCFHQFPASATAFHHLTTPLPLPLPLPLVTGKELWSVGRPLFRRNGSQTTENIEKIVAQKTSILCKTMIPGSLYVQCMQN